MGERKSKCSQAEKKGRRIKVARGVFTSRARQTLVRLGNVVINEVASNDDVDK